MLDRAERLHRQFFTHATAYWEPPVDIVESGETLHVYIALPGVSAEAITVAVEPAGITVSAVRAFPCREEHAQIHRIEIPYGRFERQIGLPLADPYSGLELAGQSLAHGVLKLRFRKKEGA